MKLLGILFFGLSIIVLSSCDNDFTQKKYEITFKDGKRDTLYAVNAYDVGDGYIGFISKDKTTAGMYHLGDIQHFKVIEDKGK